MKSKAPLATRLSAQQQWMDSELGICGREVMTEEEEEKTLVNRHKAVTIGLFFTGNMFRTLTLQVRWQG